MAVRGGSDTVKITFTYDPLGEGAQVLVADMLGYKVDGECVDGETGEMLNPLESNPMVVEKGVPFRLPECVAISGAHHFDIDGQRYELGAEYIATADTTALVVND